MSAAWAEAWVDAKQNGDALLFATGVLGFLMPGVDNPDQHPQLEPWQVDALNRVSRMYQQRFVKPARLSIKAGHSVGKTTLLAIVALFVLCCAEKDIKIPVVSASQDQLRSGLWPEMQKWINRLPEAFRSEITWTGERVTWTKDPTQVFAVQRTASKNKPEVLQGMHSKTMLAIFEEASGIIEEAYEASLGALASAGAMCICVSNPTRRTGYFHATQTSMRDSWDCMTVNCEDVPRARSHIQDIIDRYGKDSNAYRVRVLGQFPEKDDDTVIPLSWIEAAVARQISKTHHWPNWGVDVAFQGDDRATLLIREGNYLMGAYVWSGLTDQQLKGRIISIWEQTPLHMRPKNICIDANGVGKALYSLLADSGPLKHLVREIVVTKKAEYSDRYKTLRDELWWKGREWFGTQTVCLPNDIALGGPNTEEMRKAREGLIAELSTLTYDMASDGRIVVQSKKDAKENGLLRSPDLADGFLMTFGAYDEPRESANDAHRRHRLSNEQRDPWSI